MLDETYDAVFTDARGRDTTRIHNDGHELRLSLRGVDFPFLAARLRASSAHEKLTNLWLDRLLAKGTVARI